MMRRTLASLLIAWCICLSPQIVSRTSLAIAQPTTPGSSNRTPTPSDKQDESLPLLSEPVNDFASLIDEPNRQALDRMVRALQSATGDAIAVVTVPSYAPYGSIQEYAVKLFQNHGRALGQKGKDNGLLVVVAQSERKVWIEVGYGLEGIITDGFAGETSRQYMAPYFRQGQYGNGLKAGVGRIIARIADERKVSLGADAPQVAPPPARARSRNTGVPVIFWVIAAVIVFQVLRALFFGGRGGRGGWGGGGWSGWSGGVGTFGGGSWGGGFGGGGGGGGGGGWGGFGGGSSGGGGGGASW